MNKNQKILIGAVTVLVLLNITLIAVIWHHSPIRVRLGSEGDPRPTREMAERFLPRQLNLSPDQAKQFRLLFREHQRNMTGLQEEMRRFKGQMHEAIVWGDSVSYNELYDDFADRQLQVEQEFVRFIGDLSAICDNEQKVKLIDALNRSMHQPQRRGGR